MGIYGGYRILNGGLYFEVINSRCIRKKYNFYHEGHEEHEGIKKIYSFFLHLLRVPRGFIKLLSFCDFLRSHQ
jgi:hypothetical protein